MIKPIAEFLLGVCMVLLLLGKYGDMNHPSKPLVAYITDSGVLQPIIYILLIIFAYRLIGGKHKDYSKFFYNLLVKLFGDPQKRKR
ncbi:MAG: hypothetical protein ACTHOB_14100 [Ginsengibacter sp.]